LQLVFRSIALAKLLYAVPAWWGFTNAGDRNRLEGFLRRAQKAGYYNNDSLPTVAAHCDQADEQLFSGRLKMRDMKMRHKENCRAGKCRNGKCGTKLRGWKMRDWKMWHKNAGHENAGNENTA